MTRDFPQASLSCLHGQNPSIFRSSDRVRQAHQPRSGRRNGAPQAQGSSPLSFRNRFPDRLVCNASSYSHENDGREPSRPRKYQINTRSFPHDFRGPFCRDRGTINTPPQNKHRTIRRKVKVCNEAPGGRKDRCGSILNPLSINRHPSFRSGEKEFLRCSEPAFLGRLRRRTVFCHADESRGPTTARSRQRREATGFRNPRARSGAGHSGDVDSGSGARPAFAELEGPMGGSERHGACTMGRGTWVLATTVAVGAVD